MTGPRFVTHATFKASNAARISSVGVYDRLNGYAEVEWFYGMGAPDLVARAEQLAAQLNETPPTGPAPAPRAWGIVDALNARLA